MHRNRKPWPVAAIACVCAFVTTPGAHAADNAKGAVNVSVTIRADQPGDVINPNVYGQFAEHLGAGIY